MSLYTPAVELAFRTTTQSVMEAEGGRPEETRTKGPCLAAGLMIPAEEAAARSAV